MLPPACLKPAMAQCTCLQCMPTCSAWLPVTNRWAERKRQLWEPIAPSPVHNKVGVAKCTDCKQTFVVHGRSIQRELCCCMHGLDGCSAKGTHQSTCHIHCLFHSPVATHVHIRLVIEPAAADSMAKALVRPTCWLRSVVPDRSAGSLMICGALELTRGANSAGLHRRIRDSSGNNKEVAAAVGCASSGNQGKAGTEAEPEQYHNSSITAVALQVATERQSFQRLRQS